jgi:hypothetical protein
MRKERRQQRGSAWHWKQTDSWYDTPPGTQKRIPLFDEQGDRIRGKDNKESAQLALARIKHAEELSPIVEPVANDWTAAWVCDEYLAALHRTANRDWAKQVERWLNDFCGYCGALQVSELKKMQLRTWMQEQTTWNHNTHRNVISSPDGCVTFRSTPTRPSICYRAN